MALEVILTREWLVRDLQSCEELTRAGGSSGVRVIPLKVHSAKRSEEGSHSDLTKTLAYFVCVRERVCDRVEHR